MWLNKSELLKGDIETLEDALYRKCYDDYSKLEQYKKLVDLVGRMS